MAKKRPFNVLVLCTGNSARSILAEGLFNAAGAGRIAAYSAGSKPQGTPHPEALKVLQAKGHATDFARSKSWDEFEGVHKVNFVFMNLGKFLIVGVVELY